MPKAVKHTKLDEAIKSALNINPANGDALPWSEIEPNIQKRSGKQPFKEFAFSLNSFVGTLSLTSFLNKDAVFVFAKKWAVSMYVFAGSIAVGSGGYYMYQSFSVPSNKVVANKLYNNTLEKTSITSKSTISFSLAGNISKLAEQLKKGVELAAVANTVVSQNEQTAILNQPEKNVSSSSFAVAANESIMIPVGRESNSNSLPSADFSDPVQLKMDGVDPNQVNDFSNFSDPDAIIVSDDKQTGKSQLFGEDNVPDVAADNNETKAEKTNRKKGVESRAKDESIEGGVSENKGLLNKLFSKSPKSRYKRAAK